MADFSSKMQMQIPADQMPDPTTGNVVPTSDAAAEEMAATEASMSAAQEAINSSRPDRQIGADPNG